ncbi:IF factor, partial [Bucorvus abyssinicus]|nr:IF factor [Bucorvus abyssinicus]
ENSGMVGNIYSMGLVMQALEAASKFYSPREWDCAQAFAVVLRHDYHQPMAIAQVLPALVNKPYLDADSLDHATSTGMSPSRQLPSPLPAAPIMVHYAVINTLQGQPFHYTITVNVPRGSTLLRVLEVAVEKEPNKFSFKTENTSWGPMVVSIHGLAANPKDRTYWRFLSGTDALQEGVGSYKPHNGEHIEAVFSTY